MATITDFLLNRQPKAAEVSTPAFSLTKVLSSGAIIIGPIATLLVDKVAKINFSAGQLVALAIGLLGFLAITASADVLGRSYAAAASSRSDAATAELQASQAAGSTFVPFPHPVEGRKILATGEDPPVEIYGSAFGDQGYFLVRESGAFSWLPAATVTFGETTKAGT